MTVKELIAELEKMDENDHVFVGAQGYTNSMSEDKSIFVENGESGVYITDTCFYEEVIY